MEMGKFSLQQFQEGDHLLEKAQLCKRQTEMIGGPLGGSTGPGGIKRDIDTVLLESTALQPFRPGDFSSMSCFGSRPRRKKMCRVWARDFFR